MILADVLFRADRCRVGHHRADRCRAGHLRADRPRAECLMTEQGMTVPLKGDMDRKDMNRAGKWPEDPGKERDVRVVLFR